MYPKRKQISPCAACEMRHQEKTCAVYCEATKKYDSAIRHDRYTEYIPPPLNPGAVPEPRYKSGKQYSWITPEAMKQIKRLHKKGLNGKQISAVVGYCSTTINKAIKRGFTLPHPKVAVVEKQEIIERYKNGETCFAISKKMHRNYQTVKKIIQTQQI